MSQMLNAKSSKPGRLGSELAIVTLTYTGLTAAVTWPVVIHMFDAVAGFDGRDSLQWVWFNWWGAKSLLVLQHSPTQVDWLYYPQGAAHPILQATMFVPLLALPVTLAGGVRFAYNLMFLLSFVLGGLLTYLLLLSLARHRPAAFVAGVIFIFAPARMGHALAGHLLLISTWSLPLFALAVIYLCRQPSWRWMLLASLALTVLTLTQPIHLAYFAVPFAAVYGGAALLSRQGVGRFRRVLPYLAAAGGVTAILLAPFWASLLTATWQGEQEFFTSAGLEEHSTDLLAFVLPSPYHPLWAGAAEPPAWLTGVIGSTRDLEEQVAYLGILPLGLAVWAVARRQPGVYLWLGLALLAVLLAMGPSLKVLGQNTGWPLPYSWLMDLPFLRWSRTPGRLNETTSLALAVLAAFGLADLLRRLGTGRQQWLVAALAICVILVDYLVFFPFPLGGQKMPGFYRRLAAEPPPGPVLDMPVTGSRRASNYSLLYQTVHNRPISGGYIERDPPGTVEWAQFFDRLLSPVPSTQVVEQSPGLAVRQQILRQLGPRQVVARRWLMTDQAATATLSFMPNILGEAYYVDDDLLAWRVPPVETTLPPYTLLLAEKGWEGIQEGALVRLKQEGLLFIYAARPGPATLVLELPGHSSVRPLWVAQSGPFRTDGQGLRHQIPLQLQAGLNWLNFRLADCDPCEVDFSRIRVD